NVITGKKGTGKSHLAKLLVIGLATLGGVCIVLDVNGEYVNLGYTDGGEEAPLNGRVLALSPGMSFKVTLEYAGLGAVLSIMSSVLDLPASSAWEFRRIWSRLSASRGLSLARLEESIKRVNNDFIRDALLRRFETMTSTRFFTDDEAESTTLEECLGKVEGGGALIIDLSNMPSSFRRIVVEFVLRKLSKLLERWFIRAVFLFAEEAHLYLRETYWDDIVTRMRHIGVFTTFVTNQPDSLRGGIYRQADNIFLFNFTNENDLAVVSRAAKVDGETVNSIARELPPHCCLALGEVVDDFPLVVEVKPLKVKTMGETRLFFGGVLRG
ncbi:MAG: ATP-binding protein, partial [Candidatus Bathyarchaeia archaeon]